MLVAALSLPSPAGYTPSDSVFARRFTRGEIQYNRTSTAGMPSMIAVGVRSDDVTLDGVFPRAGSGLGTLKSGLSVTAGAQQLFARTQQPRFALALALGG